MVKVGADYYQYTHDHLYSPVALANLAGTTVLERYEYDAYGNPYILEPNFADDPDGQSDYGNPYLFTGRRVDILDNGSLKIQYHRNRYYDYYTGRWTTQDPIRYVKGLNLYGYARGNPITFKDPMGTVPINLITGDNYIVDDPPPVTEDLQLALLLMANYVWPQEDPFTRGEIVVKRQGLIKGTLQDALDNFAIELCAAARCGGAKSGSLSLDRATVLRYARQTHAGAILACHDSKWMGKTLNIPTDFSVSDDFKITASCTKCTVRFNNVKYTYIDRADMHMFRNGCPLPPDIYIVLINYTMPLHWIGLVNQPYDIQISWTESSLATYRYEETWGHWQMVSPRSGWPFK